MNLLVIQEKRRAPIEASLLGIAMIAYLVMNFIFYSNITAAEAYSESSIVLGSRGNIVDDYREAYYW